MTLDPFFRLLLSQATAFHSKLGQFISYWWSPIAPDNPKYVFSSTLGPLLGFPLLIILISSYTGDGTALSPMLEE
jgi:hypothetical protein